MYKLILMLLVLAVANPATAAKPNCDKLLKQWSTSHNQHQKTEHIFKKIVKECINTNNKPLTQKKNKKVR